MKNKQSTPGFFANVLSVTKSCYNMCSGNTRINFKRLGMSLFFTVLICGAVLAASFCEFWLNRDYRWMPLIFIGTGLFYYILDTAIIMGDQGRGHVWLKRMRVIIALVLALFNSFLIDYYFFKADIEAARISEIHSVQTGIAEQFDNQLAKKEQQKLSLLKDIDMLQSKLSGQLDSLNAEANGMGGSKHRGIARVWMSKYKAYQSDSIRYGELVYHKRLLVTQLDKENFQLATEKNKGLAAVTPTVSNGINKSLQLLHKIIWLDGKFTNKLMSVLILLVSMLLELVPLIAKSFYDVEEYFEVAQHQKEICNTNSGLRKQHAIHKEAGRLMNENSLGMAVEVSEHRMNMIKEKMEHSRMMMQETEAYMDELIQNEKRWEEKYPFIINKYGRPILEHAYETLTAAAI